MTDREDTIKGNRIFFLDNLRTFMIFLVVLLHSGLVYEKNVFSAFIWIVYDPATNNIAPFLRIILDIFVMAVIFFISGFLKPLSLKNRNGWAFLKTKFKRLMIPWLIAVLTLIPLYKWIFLYARNLPQQNWTTYFHWSNGIWGQNWLWFLPVLFLFDILYLAFSRVKVKFHLTLKQAVGIVFLLGFLYSVCMDMLHIQGWTKTILLDFQNERLLIYLLIFFLGSHCYRLKCFDSKPKNMRILILIICTAWIPILAYRYFYLNALLKPGVFVISEMIDTLLLWFTFHLSLFSLLYLMIHTFRVYLDKQGKFIHVLNQNSYPVYIIHTVVMGGLAVVLLHIRLPSLIKFLFLTVSTFSISNLFIYLYRITIQSTTGLIRKPSNL